MPTTETSLQYNNIDNGQLINNNITNDLPVSKTLTNLVNTGVGKLNSPAT